MSLDDDGGHGRSANGRWVKGHCPNPKGRPRKEPPISDADVGFFKDTLVEATINGEKRLLTRHQLLLHVMFDQAVKGKSVSLTRELFGRFEETETAMADLDQWIRDESDKFIDDYDNKGKFDEKRAADLLELIALRNYGQKPEPARRSRAKPDPSPVSWRKGPKSPQLLELEAQQKAEERKRRNDRARAPKPPRAPGNND